MKARRSFVALGFLLCHAAAAGRTLAASDSFEADLAFGDELMMQKRYPAAELEYERLAAIHPADPRRDEAIARMLNAAHQTEDYTFSLSLSRSWRDRLPDPSRCLPALYAVQSLYDLENYSGALSEGFPGDCPVDIHARYQYVRGLSRLRLKDWNGAPQEFGAVNAGSVWRKNADEAAAGAPEGAVIHWKSPALAGTLSAVVPGSGYLYSDRPQTAAAAFTVCGLFGGATYSAAHAGQPGLAALLALLSLGWYSGGIYGSVQAAHRENTSRLSQFVQHFEIRW